MKEITVTLNESTYDLCKFILSKEIKFWEREYETNTLPDGSLDSQLAEFLQELKHLEYLFLTAEFINFEDPF